MLTPDELKQRVDMHDLADRLGLDRPHIRGNYKSPQHDDKSPSLSIFQADSGFMFKDHSTQAKGSVIDLVMYVQGIEAGAAMKWLHESYGFPMQPKNSNEPRREKSRAEFIAERCYQHANRAIEYLVGRGISETVATAAVKSKSVGFNDWHSDKIPNGQPGHGGASVAFIVKSMNPGHVHAVDMRYLDPAINGGVKTQCQGEKSGFVWYQDLRKLKAAHTVYVVESPINALSIDTAGIAGAAAVAVRGTNVEAIDWRFLAGKRVRICMDADLVNDRGDQPGPEAGWRLLEILTSMNIAAMMVDQLEWFESEWNDVNDVLQAAGGTELRSLLHKNEPWVIGGVPGGNGDKPIPFKTRVFLPAHDFSQYWRYRTKEDFVTYVKGVTTDDNGNDQQQFGDVCGFRVASISRVSIASATSTMTGEEDSQPRVLFAVAVQAPRHGPLLQRRVFEDERVHNVDQWRKFGPVFNQSAFLRMINIMERGADLGARNAANFVGLCWRENKMIVNEGPDCYFTDPDKQCPYSNLTFPSGTHEHARQVIAEYQKTFTQNAALMMLVWSLGGHLKTILGFWPHLTLQADKGMGKSTLIKRLERTIAFTMFSGQSLQTEFRLLTSISHTSHPVGWEELSARKQDVIDKAVAMLQESYQYTVSRRGSDMTEYLLSAPVLLAGEDVPVKSLLGKVVRVELTRKKGPMMPEDLPKFPLRQWLLYLANRGRKEVGEIYQNARTYCLENSRASGEDDGAVRMAGNYAALLTAWRLLCDFTQTDVRDGNFIGDLLAEMNSHIAETSADREPWVWIVETILSELDANQYRHPYAFDSFTHADSIEAEDCLVIRSSHMMDHISHTSSLRDKWNALPVKSDRVFKKQLIASGVVIKDDVDRTIAGRRVGHMLAISTRRLAEYGLYVGEKVGEFG